METWVETRDRWCAGIRTEARALRLKCGQLDALATGQSVDRATLEARLWQDHERLQEALRRIAKPPSSRYLSHVTWSERFGFSVNDGRPDESHWTSDQRTAYAREFARMQRLASDLNNGSGVDLARFEARQAADAYRVALRRSVSSPGLPARQVRRSSGVFAALPFFAFLLVSAVGVFFEPVGVAAWTAVALLSLAIAVGALGALREAPSAGVLAGLGAAASLAVFLLAYTACRALGPESIVRSSGEALPIHSIGDAGLVTLSVGLTGAPLGVELEGAARIIAFIQILLTISGVAAVAVFGWRTLLARVERPADNDQIFD
jgi:hypothetical protein